MYVPVGHKVQQCLLERTDRVEHSISNLSVVSSSLTCVTSQISRERTKSFPSLLCIPIMNTSEKETGSVTMVDPRGGDQPETVGSDTGVYRVSPVTLDVFFTLPPCRYFCSRFLSSFFFFGGLHKFFGKLGTPTYRVVQRLNFLQRYSDTRMFIMKG